MELLEFGVGITADAPGGLECVPVLTRVKTLSLSIQCRDRGCLKTLLESGPFQTRLKKAGTKAGQTLLRFWQTLAIPADKC